MKQHLHLNWPLYGLIAYLLALLVSGLVYANTQYKTSSLSLTGITRLSQSADTVKLTVRGFGLDKKLQAHLSLDAANRRAIVGTLPIWGQSVDIEIVSDRAYVSNLGEGVKVFDLRLPVAPELIGSTSKLPGQSWRVDADEKRIYLSSMLSQMLVYDIASQKMLYQFETGGRSFSSIHRDQQLFVANSRAGLAIFDISSNKKPRLLGRLSLPGITADLTFFGDFLVASSKRGGLHLIDISDVTQPRLLQTIAAGYSYGKVAVVGDFVYAADRGLKLDIFSLSGSGRLSLQSSIPLFDGVRDFLLDDWRLYVAEGSFGVSVMDVSDPALPRRIGYVGTSGGLGGLALYGDYLYVVSDSQGVQIIDTRRVIPRKLMAAIDTPGKAYDLELDGRWIYVADGVAGLQVIDRDDRENLKLVASLPTGSEVVSITKSKNMLFLAVKREGLFVVDVQDPLRPRLVSRLHTTVDLSDLVIQGTTLFASSLEKKLLRIDISNPIQPRVAETIDLPGRAWRIALSGDDIFVAAEKAGLQIVRFTPGQPGRIISSLLRPWPMNPFAETFGVAVHGDYAYLVQGEEGLQIVDISDPERPKEVGLVKIPGQSLGIRLADNFAILSSRWGGYNFVDISQPKHPYLAANIYQSHSSGGFVIEAGSLYALGRFTGISVIPLPVRDTGISQSSGLSISFKKPQHPGWYRLSVSDGEKLETATAFLKVD